MVQIPKAQKEIHQTVILPPTVVPGHPGSPPGCSHCLVPHASFQKIFAHGASGYMCFLFTGISITQPRAQEAFLFNLAMHPEVCSCSSAPYHSVLCQDIAELTYSALLHVYVASNILLLPKCMQ